MPLISWHNRGQREPGVVEWLRRDRWFTDTEAAERSRYIYSDVGGGRSGTSILGVLNGWLCAAGLVLVVSWDNATDRYWFTLRRRWW